MPDGKQDLSELEPAELETVVSALGAERFHARQIFRWIHRRGCERFDGMTNPFTGSEVTARARLHHRDSGGHLA